MAETPHEVPFILKAQDGLAVADPGGGSPAPRRYMERRTRPRIDVGGHRLEAAEVVGRQPEQLPRVRPRLQEATTAVAVAAVVAARARAVPVPRMVVA